MDRKGLVVIELLIALAVICVLALLFTGGADAGSRLSFELNAIENSSPASLGASYPDFACQVTTRTGIGNTVLELQGSIVPSISNNLSWVALANTTVVNTTSAGTDNSSWHFQSLTAYASTIRMHVLSGAGASNTVAGECVAGGR